jgi:hypothetical protein
MLSIYAFKEGNKLDLVPLMYYVQCLLYQCLSAYIFLHFLIFCFSLQEHLSLPSLSHILAAPMPCAFYASSFYSLCVMSIQCTIPLLCIPAAVHSSFYMPESLSTTATISSLFLHTYSLYAPCACTVAMLLHALSMSSALPDHHCNSSASLEVKPMHPSLLGVMSRFLRLSNSRDSSSSLL